MINITDNWDLFQIYCGQELGIYQLLENDNGIDVRILVGRSGFKREFLSYNDSLLNKILAFCRRHGYIQLSQTTQTSKFFQ
jgi:hypothetical protein